MMIPIPTLAVLVVVPLIDSEAKVPNDVDTIRATVRRWVTAPLRGRSTRTSRTTRGVADDPLGTEAALHVRADRHGARGFAIPRKDGFSFYEFEFAAKKMLKRLTIAKKLSSART